MSSSVSYRGGVTEEPEGPGFDIASVVTDAVVTREVDDDEVTVTASDVETDEGSSMRARAAASVASSPFETLRGLFEAVPAAPAGPPRPPRSGSAFRTTDSLGRSADALDVIANPVQPAPSYLGIYHINLSAGRFALCLAASRDLKTWRKIADLDPTGGSMGTIRALSDGGFLVAYEAQRQTTQDGKIASNLQLRYYRDPAALLNGQATEQKTLPRRLSRTNEGTPDLRSIAWRGSLAKSQIVLGFHYLDCGPKSKPFKLAVDRQARGTLDMDKWSVVEDAGIDRALSRLGFHGNHGARRQFHFPAGGKTWRVYEAQKAVNVTGSWRVLLFDNSARRFNVLRIQTPNRSRSFANPTINVLPSPHPAGGRAFVVTMFVFGAGAGAGESGQLVYYSDL
jgi:hypothetical protein